MPVYRLADQLPRRPILYVTHPSSVDRATEPATNRPAVELGTGIAASSTTQGGGGMAVLVSPACKTAVDRATTMLAVAVRVGEALTGNAEVACGEPARFDRALAAYRQVVDCCTLRVP